MSADQILLDLERRHAAAIAAATQADDDNACEAALTFADGLVAALSGIAATTLDGLGAKARVFKRQAAGVADGRLAALIEHSAAERLLAASTLADAARLLTPRRKREARSANRRALARPVGIVPRPLDESGELAQDSGLRRGIATSSR